MSAVWRAVGDDDEKRERAVGTFLGYYEKSPSTQRTMKSALVSIVSLFPERPSDIATFPWELAADPTFYDETQYRAVSGYSSATASKLMSALRQLLRVLCRHGLVDADLLWSTLESARPVRGATNPPTRGLTTEELRLMLGACCHEPNEPLGARDAAVLALLASTGARRSEVAKVERSHLDLDEWTVQLRVKGQEWRTAVVHPAAQEYLQAWFQYSPTGKYIFCPVQKDALVVDGKGICDRTVARVVNKRRDQAGLDQRITTHSIRRWFVSSLLDSGADLLTVSRSVGHKNPATTQLYDKRDERELRRVVRALDLPTIEEAENQEAPTRAQGLNDGE